mgnify:CR=1 FL=1
MSGIVEYLGIPCGFAIELVSYTKRQIRDDVIFEWSHTNVRGRITFFRSKSAQPAVIEYLLVFVNAKIIISL